LAEQVHRDDGPRAWREQARDLVHVDVERALVDVREHRRCPRVRYRFRGGEEGEAGDDDLVAFPRTCGEQREQQRIGPGIHGSRVLASRHGRELALQRLHLGSEHVAARCENAVHCGIDLLSQQAVLGGRIGHRHACVHAERDAMYWRRSRT
jgi:hypothetical protein